MSAAPIGVFDSGVGGLSVLRHLRAQLPHENFIYIADQAHVPYGRRPLADIRALSEAITRFLLSHEAKLIVIACNTASGAALNSLRRTFPSLPFVGMEPAVKPAAAQTKSGKVGVLATVGTFESQRYLSLMNRFAKEVEVFENPCIGLVERIEDGQLDGEETAVLLQNCVQPMLDAGVDTLVLGCTHYPFIRPLLEQICQTNTSPEPVEGRSSTGSVRTISIIDPAPAIARQTTRLLAKNGLKNDAGAMGSLLLYTSGDANRMTAQARQLLSDKSLPKAAHRAILPAVMGH